MGGSCSKSIDNNELGEPPRNSGTMKQIDSGETQSENIEYDTRFWDQ